MDKYNQLELHITETTPLQPAIQSWQVFLSDQGKSIHTVKAFVADLQLLATFFSPDKMVSSISTSELNSFLEWLKNERPIPCSPKSLARRITSIKSFFRWMHVNGRILSDPAENVLQHSVISPLPEVLSNDEQKKLEETATQYIQNEPSDSRYFVLYKLLITTGIKKGECLALQVNHIDLYSAPTPFLFIRYARPADRYKERKIHLSADWIAVYERYLDQFHPSDKVFPWSPRRLEYLLEDLSKSAGIAKHVSFDMCRWTCALNDWKSGLESDSLRQKLGISKIQWREISMKLRNLDEQTKT